MAPPNKRDAPLPVIQTNADWNALLKQPLLYVVDAFDGWAGPCTAIHSLLKKMKFTLSAADFDLLQFVCVNIDKVDSLQHFRGLCEPNFLFYGSGVLMGQVRGCNAPLIISTIQQTLSMECDAQRNGGERVEIVPTVFGTEDEELAVNAGEGEDYDDDNASVMSSIFDEREVELTVGLIKPDIISNKQITEIIKKIKNRGIEILERREMILTEEEVKALYADHEGETYFEHMVEYMTSGPCQVLVMTQGKTGDGIVEVWKELIGPFDAAVAKQQKPKSLRALYGLDAAINAVHGSANYEAARQELKFLCPDFKAPKFIQINKKRYACSKFRRNKAGAKLSRTLAIIRPDALRNFRDGILQSIEKLGLKIAIKKEIELTKDQARAFYDEQRGELHYQLLVRQMTYGPILALCLTHEEEAVNRWRNSLGPANVNDFVDNPNCLRAQFHVSGLKVNSLHGSEDVERAENELGAFFQMDQTLAIIKPEGYVFKEKILAKMEAAGFVVSAHRRVDISAPLAKEMYYNLTRKTFFEDLIYLVTSSPSLAVVLSAENAVKKLRKFIGPTNPIRARRKHPKSLRAHFGFDILANSVHAVSTEQDARDLIKKLFPDTRFDWDGYCTENPKKEISLDRYDLLPRLRKLGPSADSESEEEDSDGDPDFIDPGPFVFLANYHEPTDEELAEKAAREQVAREAAAVAAAKAKAKKDKRDKKRKELRKQKIKGQRSKPEGGKGKGGKGKKRKGKKGKGKKGKGKKGKEEHVEVGKCPTKKKEIKIVETENTGKVKSNQTLDDFAVRTSRSWGQLKLSRSQEAFAVEQAAIVRKLAAAREAAEKEAAYRAEYGIGGEYGGGGEYGEEYSERNEYSTASAVRRARKKKKAHAGKGKGKAHGKKKDKTDKIEKIEEKVVEEEIFECVNSDNPNPLAKKCSSIRDCEAVSRQASKVEIIECVNSDNPLTKKCSSIRDCNSVNSATSVNSGVGVGCCRSSQSATGNRSSTAVIECVNSDNPLTKKCSSAKDCAEVAKRTSSSIMNDTCATKTESQSKIGCYGSGSRTSAGNPASVIDCVNSDNPLTKKCSSAKDCTEVAKRTSSSILMDTCATKTESQSKIGCCGSGSRTSAGNPSSVIECVLSDNPLTKKCSSIQDCHAIIKSASDAGKSCENMKFAAISDKKSRQSNCSKGESCCSIAGSGGEE